ncbi:hypothetical protein [Archangium sp.]|uniref:hypothetical protein n=1 Tax=Archangium sp. TaxID=1872627 RepID=UPI002EDA63A1
MSALLVGGGLGCNTSPSLLETEPLEQQAQELIEENGLSTNGLSTNGLSTSTFSSWFSAAPTQNTQLMKYLIGCALPEGQVRTYTDPQTGTSYTWAGKLGLASHWGSGRPATEQEEQVISACLAAHANPYGMKVGFSVLGLTAEGNVLPYTAQELGDYNIREACFFGNLFRNQGLYAGNDHTQLDSSKSTNRGCGLSNVASGENPHCPIIVRVGTCDAARCVPDATGTYYTQCTYNGVNYRPVTTRLHVNAVNICGDGICQKSERCGVGTTADNCSDCGACR